MLVESELKRRYCVFLKPWCFVFSVCVCVCDCDCVCLSVTSCLYVCLCVCMFVFLGGRAGLVAHGFKTLETRNSTVFKKLKGKWVRHEHESSLFICCSLAAYIYIKYTYTHM